MQFFRSEFVAYRKSGGARMMTTEIVSHQVESIGKMAGLVWQFLEQSEPVTLSKLARELDVPRDLVMQGVGWLAREDKIEFHEGARSKLITVK
jgi:hypothetical protein